MDNKFRMVPGWQTGISIRDMEWEEVRSLVSDVTPGTETIKIVRNDEDEYRINAGRNRYSVLLNDPRCPVCGIIGTDWSLDHQTNDGKIVPGGYVINLYAQIESNKILMTMDHIVPRCDGGVDNVSNLRTMCWTCNQVRGNTGMSVETMRGVLTLTKHIIHNKEIMDEAELTIINLTKQRDDALRVAASLSRNLKNIPAVRADLFKKLHDNIKLADDIKHQIESKLMEYQKSTSNTKTMTAY